MRTKRIGLAGLIFIALSSGATTLGGYKLFFEKEKNNALPSSIQTENSNREIVNLPNFSDAAKSTVNVVVNVKNVAYRRVSDPILEFFYGYQGGRTEAQIGTGSGVIISEDGYIVTNNHVIKGANELEITLNDNRVYPAQLIGTDPKMDIALLKINAKEKLPFIKFGDSDKVEIGEWVLAVGNPYNLNSTVTAGIVSAKARDLELQGIQSFIQTDAAVNPGNSGGALVNTKGELIGINTMISSNTGSYVGYSFAVPSNITARIVDDLKKYGRVQQGVLGISGYDINAQNSAQLGHNNALGVFVATVLPNSGADKAGIKKGDIIVEVEGNKIQKFADLNSVMIGKKPNDVVKVKWIRNGKEYTASVTLIDRTLRY